MKKQIELDTENPRAAIKDMASKLWATVNINVIEELNENGKSARQRRALARELDKIVSKFSLGRVA